MRRLFYKTNVKHFKGNFASYMSKVDAIVNFVVVNVKLNKNLGTFCTKNKRIMDFI